MVFAKFIRNKVKINLNQKFALIIGETPSSGARSPALWNRAYVSINKNIRMYPADVEDKNLRNIILSLKKNKNFIGGSVTIPYKVSIMKILDKVDDNSKKIGSINTIVKIKKSNKLMGLNTDYFGSLNTFKNIKIGKSSKKILVLGCGGAGKACILAALKVFKNNYFYFFNRDKNKLKKFIDKINIISKYKIIKNYSELKKISNLDLVINTTSVGFNSWIKIKGKYYNYKYFSPLSNLHKIQGINKINNFKFYKKNYILCKKNLLSSINFFLQNPKVTVFDIIYNPKQTFLMKICDLFNNECINGLNMNLAQAIKAFIQVNNINNYNKISKAMNADGK